MIKKYFIIFTLGIIIFLISCDDETTINESTNTTNELTTYSLCLYDIANTLNEGEYQISQISYYNVNYIENSIIINFENNDMAIVRKDNSFEYHMDIESDYSGAKIVVFGVYGELNSSIVQVILAVGNEATTGRIENFDITIGREIIDIEFGTYINNGNISEEIAVEMYINNGIEFQSRVENFFENILNVEFK
jgi:hypothetical protein